MNKKNKEGYSDPTAYEALSKIEKEEKNVKQVREALSKVCEVAGYHLKGQISLVDKKTGRTFRL